MLNFANTAMALARTILLAGWDTLCEMAPYLLFGFLAAGALSVFVRPQTIERYMGGRGLWSVFKASLFGVPLPLCSCSVIPVAASLRRHGASKGATAAFLLSTPQTGVDSILVTFSLLGPVFALFRPIAAFVSGLLGGAAVEFSSRQDGASESVPACHDDCCADHAHGSRLLRMVRYGFLTLPSDIGIALLLGLAVAGGISALIPNDFFLRTVGGGFAAMLLMMAVGIPIYVCATASVPIAAAMMSKGVSPGAALVFLMTGPATNAAGIAAVWRTMGPRTAVVYLAAVAFTALGSGLLLDLFSASLPVTQAHAGHTSLPGPVRMLCAVAVLALLLQPGLRRIFRRYGDREK
jgi:uncharacterized membrane protein YraQ (UPF0718 family)